MKRLRALRGQQGQALVEFALVSIVFFVLVFGMIDVVRAVWNYNTLAEATREGTRYAIVHGSQSSDPSGPGDTLAVEDAVEKFASGLNASQLTIEATWPDGGNVAGNRVKVSSQYSYQPMFGFFGPFSIQLTSSSTMKITY